MAVAVAAVAVAAAVGMQVLVGSVSSCKLRAVQITAVGQHCAAATVVCIL
jgi:hypothetical protein